MKINLKDYFTERELFKELMRKPGPVITISREFGCGAIALAERLVRKLNKGSVKNYKWGYISKEIIDEAAMELRIKPLQIEQSLSSEEKGVLQNILDSFKHEWQVPSSKMTKTVKKIIESYAYKGYTVLVGRGGVALAHDIESSLHIKLMAPLDWRIHKVRESLGKKVSDLKQAVLLEDKKRDIFISQLLGRPVDDSVFDVILNRASLSDEEILDTIMLLMEKKRLL